jgi:hypothetical protein
MLLIRERIDILAPRVQFLLLPGEKIGALHEDLNKGDELYSSYLTEDVTLSPK